MPDNLIWRVNMNDLDKEIDKFMTVFILVNIMLVQLMRLKKL